MSRSCENVAQPVCWKMPPRGHSQRLKLACRFWQARDRGPQPQSMGRPLECACRGGRQAGTAQRSALAASVGSGCRTERQHHAVAAESSAGMPNPGQAAVPAGLHLVEGEERVTFHIVQLALLCSRRAVNGQTRGVGHRACGRPSLCPHTHPSTMPHAGERANHPWHGMAGSLDSPASAPGCGRRAGGGGVCSAASRHSRSFSQRSTRSPSEYLPVGCVWGWVSGCGCGCGFWVGCGAQQLARGSGRIALGHIAQGTRAAGCLIKTTA